MPQADAANAHWDSLNQILYSSTGQPLAATPRIGPFWVLEHRKSVPMALATAMMTKRQYPHISKLPRENPATLDIWHL